MTTNGSRALLLALMVAAGASLSGCATAEPPVAGSKMQASADDLRQTLKETVKDAGRLSQMLAVADQIGADLATGAKELDRLQQEQARLNAEYATTPDALREIGERIQSVRTECQAKAIRARQSLARLATDKEWKKITARKLALVGN
jgi:predicted nuclease with TOPRIM domain